MPFDGFAIGGLAVGESKNEREDLCEFTAHLLPPTNRAISWASARRSTSSKRSIVAWTCSTASCRRNWRSAAPSSPPAVSCKCAAGSINSQTKNSIPPARARPAHATRGRICITSRRRVRPWAGNSSANTTSISITSSCATSEQAFWLIVSLIFIVLNALRLQESDREIPRFVPKPARQKSRYVRRLRGPYRP